MKQETSFERELLDAYSSLWHNSLFLFDGQSFSGKLTSTMPPASVQRAVSEIPAAPVVHGPLPQAAVTALWRGQLFEAIKLVRVEQNIGLDEARDLVSAYVQTQPALSNRIAKTQTDTREGLLRWLIFLLAGAVGLTYLLI
ncbi:MAG: hypothetical protein Nkreftii_001975 [Candidatus Nitrospira kreftii]|uniref:Uncharacterized protein n=1 Tax=Candidatus Nitrospira kreftii TaxID=2652173 RepID=A0A7S8IZG1_9BACT|nr:MAG: hypothetical protein Nkreftii_001975 [Candidatus Nitrospira kreftii]